MSSKENPDVPAGYVLSDIVATAKGTVSFWRSPDGKDEMYTIEGELREPIEKFAKESGLDFGQAANLLIGLAIAKSEAKQGMDGESHAQDQN